MTVQNAILHLARLWKRLSKTHPDRWPRWTAQDFDALGKVLATLPDWARQIVVKVLAD